MSATPTIRWATAQDRDAILAFVADMGFNPRDAVTWDALSMTAVTAWDSDSRLIGAVPLEPRLLRIAPGQCIPTVHETVVAVHPDHRGHGLGSRLQQAIFASPPNDAQLVTVFREEPASPAYRWYIKNGFTPAMHVESWFHDAPRALAAADPFAARAIDDPTIDWPALALLRQRCAASHAGGFIDRGSRPLRPWLSVHPYRCRYDFLLVTQPSAYALLGIGTMHSQTTRIDVLDWACDGSGSRGGLIRAVAAFAASHDYRPIRWPLSQSDSNAATLHALGFASRWSFDMLARPLAGCPSLANYLPTWRYFGIDYI
jgi:GNAT superfamily N-acetyltransferase